MADDDVEVSGGVTDLTQEAYRELTVVVGPGVEGRAEIKYGRHTRSRRINDEGDIVVTKTVAERVELPEPMGDSGISEWLTESDEGQSLLTRYGWNGETDE